MIKRSEIDPLSYVPKNYIKSVDNPNDNWIPFIGDLVNYNQESYVITAYDFTTSGTIYINIVKIDSNLYSNLFRLARIKVIRKEDFHKLSLISNKR